MSGTYENSIFRNPVEFEKFFREKYRPLCLTACRYVKNIETAEEIVQDVFVRLWEKRDQITIRGPVLAYVTTSVKNNCLNFLKHKSIVSTFEKSEIQRVYLDPSENEDEMGDFELETAIISAIDELPPQRRKIFMLSRTEGLKYAEIAEKLGLSVKTIEAQMGKALKQLRVKLSEYMSIVLFAIFNIFFNSF
jgi:RNA polymerase sigma-70 factor, ECF subfamily